MSINDEMEENETSLEADKVGTEHAVENLFTAWRSC